MNMNNLANQIALVTGASGGIGAVYDDTRVNNRKN
jgi:NADP-dependent 3-hydroxy acid dehydrogenase YdfG